MYQTKQRLNIFGQPNFLQENEPTSAFWDDDTSIPFKLSVPDYFSSPSLNISDQKPKIPPFRKNVDSRLVETYPVNRQRQEMPRQQQRQLPQKQLRKQKQQVLGQNVPVFANRQRQSYVYDRPYSTLQDYLAQKIYTNWIAKELYFSMSKLSFMTLVVGLFFLSSLLFVTGFLVAVNIYDIGSPKLSQSYTMNLPSLETPRIPTPVLSKPTITLPNVPVMSMPEVISVAETQLIGANPNIMKSGTQGHKMADVQISNTDTAHMPSAYAQLPTQALPPAPQQIPQVGAYYIPPQQLPSPTHVPLQNYAPSQQQIPVKEVVQPPVQQQVVNFSHNPVQTNPQNQQVNASLPAPQPYYPTYQNAAPYHNFVPMAQ